MKRQWVGTPNGTKDEIGVQASRIRELESIAAKHFSDAGFCEVCTPILEYYDLFEKAGLPISQENMHKLVDRSGRLLCLRPDSTIPIMRVAASALARDERPLKLFYVQPVFRSDVEHAGRSLVIRQAGVEYIGENAFEYDILKLAEQSLTALGIEKFTIEIGHAELLTSYARQLGIPDEVTEQMIGLIDQKNLVAFRSLLEDIPEIATQMESFVGISGGVEELEAISSDSASLTQAAAELKDLLKKLDSKRFSVDFSLVNNLDYYTGILFRAYAPGAANAILTGGRYDSLQAGNNEPAIGFAIDLDAVNALRGTK